MGEAEKIKTVVEYYRQATDKDNPIRGACDYEESLDGRLVKGIQSYDLMDNQKYKDIDRLLDFMNESFGFNEDILLQVRNSLMTPKEIDDDETYSRKESVRINRLMNYDGHKFDQTLRSNDRSGEFLL